MKTPANSLASVLTSHVFGLAASIAALFVIAAIAIAALLMWRSNDLLVSQIVTSLEQERAVLAQEYAEHGLSRVLESFSRKAGIEGPGLYYVQSQDGRRLAGNLQRLPDELRTKDEGGVFRYRAGAVSDEASEQPGVALRLNLGSEAVAYVGRDITDTELFANWLRRFLFIAFAALTVAAVAGGFAFSRTVLARIAAINATAHAIMKGDMSDRIALTGKDDELDALSQNLNLMLNRIEQLMLSLREVSDNIAHDLKTPLNRLRNQAEGALRDPRGSEAYREGLERTIEEADGLIRTFNALLLIARLEAGSIEKTAVRFDVADVLDDVRELYEPVAEEAGLAIETSIRRSVRIEANKHLVMQAVANLIDNAIKYGQKRVPRPACESGTPSTVTMMLQERNGQAEISVGDHGPGICNADRERVLERFVRLEESRTKPGTGLGLSLVAAVARMHGGEVRLDDNDPGLLITLSLPLNLPSGGEILPGGE